MKHEHKQLVDSSTPTAALAQFCSGLQITSLSEEEKSSAKRHLLDSIGACVGGVVQPVVRDLAALLQQIAGQGQIPVVGSDLRMDLLSATYLMAVSCHAIELDDGNREGSIHPGAVVIPAILGAGYHFDTDGASTLCAVVAGYEVAVSLAEVLHPHASQRGFQTTGVVGVQGAAAAVGRLLLLDPGTLEKALGIAASSGAGLFAYLAGGGNIKKLHPGHSAREGVFAALLAARSIIDGPQGVAEAKAGVFHAFAGIHPWKGPSTDHRAGALAITRSYIKPFPCCRHIHTAIDALFELRRQHAIDPDRVARIDVGTYEAAMPHATLGWDSLTVAQLSFRYVMAAALGTGAIELETFSDSARSDASITAHIGKIHIQLDHECCANYPKHAPARVTVTMTDGESHSLYMAQPGGSPEKPLSDDLLFEKFRMTVGDRLPAAEKDALIERIWTIERLPSIRPIIDALSSRVRDKSSPTARFG